MDIIKLIGKRCLLKLGQLHWHHSATVDEFKVVEIAPSGNWAKLQNTHGNKFWRPVTEISFVEELKDLRAGKPKDTDND